MKEIQIENLDKNLAVSKEINAPDIRLYDVRQEPFKIYGLYEPKTEDAFKRMPSDVAESVNRSVSILHRCTAGGRVRFSTNSPYVAIKAVMPKLHRYSHIALTGSSGFDIYIDSPDGFESIYHRTFVPPYDMTDGYASKIEFYESGTHYVTINLPLYSEVSELYVGIAEGSTLGEGAPYRDFAPIVYYGSSITQGACASRPGNAYQAMVTRELNIDHINLGFSSGAHGEESIMNYMAGLKMSAFVCDFDHNANNRELTETHKKLYETIRAAQPNVPYIMLSRPDFHRILASWGGNDQSAKRRRVILDTFNYAIDNGDSNVYFIDGESLYRGPFKDCCSVDSTHPNDLGFSYIANAVTAELKRILANGKMLK